MSRIWMITRKELRLIFRDRRALVILLALPILFITIIGFSVGEILGSRSESGSVRVGVVNQSQLKLSQEILGLLRDRDGLQIFEKSSIEELQADIQAGKLDAGLEIPEGFDRRVGELRLGDVMETRSGPLSVGLAGLDLHVYSTNESLGIGDLVENVVFGESLRAIGPYVVEQNGGHPERILREARLRHKSMSLTASPPVRITSPRQLSYQMLVPSYIVLFVFFVITFMARSFLSEREAGTFRRLLISPVQPQELLAGKTIPYFLLGILQTGILFIAGICLFGMSLGHSPVLLLPTIICTAAAATTLGLVTALVVRSDSQVSAYVVFILLVMGGLSGCLVPRTFLPESMQSFSLITPHAWALIAFEETIKDGEPRIAYLAKCWGVLGGFSLGFFAWGYCLFQRTVNFR